MITMRAMPALTEFQPTSFAAELLRLRNDANLSQRRLGELAGLSNTLISDLEKGIAASPHPSTLMKMAQGLVKTGSGYVDEERADDLYFSLMRAAGYVPETRRQTAEATFRSVLKARLGPDNGPLMEALIMKMTGRAGAEQRSAITVAEVLINSLPPR